MKDYSNFLKLALFDLKNIFEKKLISLQKEIVKKPFLAF